MLVPEALKLTAVKLLVEHAESGEPAPAILPSGGRDHRLLHDRRRCLCRRQSGQELAAEVERRIETALGTGESLDAKLVLLTLHADVIQPSVTEFFQLESGVE